MRVLIALLALSGFAMAQISHVSATASGDQVFFTTWLRPMGTDLRDLVKAYRFSQGEVTLLAVADRSEDEFAFVSGTSSSADGNVVGVNFGGCPNSICLGFSNNRSRIITGSGSMDFEGHVQIASDGQFALLRVGSPARFMVGPDSSQVGLWRLDIDALDASPTKIGSFPSFSGQWVADKGTALVIPTSAVGGWQLVPVEGEPLSIGPPESGTTAAHLLRDASAVIYETFDLGEDGNPPTFGPGELRIHYRNGSDRALGPRGTLKDVSDDGLTVLFTRQVNDAMQAFVLDVASGKFEQITSEPEGLDAVDLVANGDAVIAASRGRLITIDLSRGQIRRILGPLPSFEQGFIIGNFFRSPFPAIDPVPGSMYAIRGRQIATKLSVSGHPSTEPLDGISVSVGGEPAAMLWTSPSEVGFQVAWETAVSDSALLVLRHERSGWEAPIETFGVSRRKAATVLPIDDDVNVAIHHYFDRLVTRADPALPGEYIHLYVTGLGPTTPAVATGQVSPHEPLARVPLSCTWRAQDSGVEHPAEIPFAGLAPGFIGFYQVDWKVPAEPTADRIEIRCAEVGSLGVFAVMAGATQP